VTSDGDEPRPLVPHQADRTDRNGHRPDDSAPSDSTAPDPDVPQTERPGPPPVQIPDDLTFDPPFAMPEPPQWLDRWREIGPGVLVKRHKVLDLNVTLVLGDDRCLVVDTHSHDGYATELIASVRSVTSLPFVVINTHAHFDHAFGNSAFVTAQPDVAIWGHDGCRRDLTELGELQRRLTVQWLRESQREDDAAAVEAVEIVPPNQTFTDEAVVELGGRTVTLRHFGRAHTGHDAVVDVPDADVTVVGDVVEEGAPPSFEDSFPLEWAATLDALLPTLRRNVVPGHGDVVDAAFVADQRRLIAEVAEVALGLPAGADDVVIARSAVKLGIGRQAGFVALQRALATRG
jgi:glyoxylase-like metal-dependent hydrolase (beta-lactamase superfamily II)